MLAILIAVVQNETPLGRVIDLRGDVDVRIPGAKEWTKLAPDSTIVPGTELSTGLKSTVIVELSTGDRIQLAPVSQYLLLEASRVGESRRARVVGMSGFASLLPAGTEDCAIPIYPDESKASMDSGRPRGPIKLDEFPMCGNPIRVIPRRTRVLTEVEIRGQTVEVRQVRVYDLPASKP